MTVEEKPLVICSILPIGHSEGWRRCRRRRRDRFAGVALCVWPGRRSWLQRRTHFKISIGYTGRVAGTPIRRACRGTQQHGPAPGTTVHPGSNGRWDKRPWEGPSGLNQKPGWYFPDRTPAAFGLFLKSAIDWMDAHPEQTTKERLVLVYAWNEFGEGGYIAPTQGDPDGRYLKALKSVVLR